MFNGTGNVDAKVPGSTRTAEGSRIAGHKTGKSFLITIDFSSSKPIYRQLVDRIIALIASEDLIPGDTLPSSRKMSSLLGINYHTVNKAYDMLIDAGFAEMNHKRVKVIGKIRKKNDEKIDPDWLERDRLIIAEAISRGYSKQKIMDSVESIIDSILGGDKH